MDETRKRKLFESMYKANRKANKAWKAYDRSGCKDEELGKKLCAAANYFMGMLEVAKRLQLADEYDAYRAGRGWPRK